MRYGISIICILIIVLVASSFSYYFGDWMWLSRSGSVIVVVAIALEYWPVILKKSVDDMSFYETQESHTATRYAVAIALFGTLIWGYGDLFCRIFEQCK